MNKWPSFVRLLCLCAVVSVTCPQAVGAQQPAAPVGTGAPQTPPAPLGVSPRGALIRAMLVPGWGHAAIGSYTRGGFYFALEATTAYTFLRTRGRLSEARERAALRESVLRARLADEGVTDPTEITTRLDADAALGGLEDLVSSREGQQEDLIAWGIFLIFLTGADAYVSAHLSRFPTPIEMEASASPDGRGEVMLRIPLPR
ncbi:MAG TPA: hypothetical protein VM198_04785 [Longimicrobiales bacterium]|nr:hypothetical protein [Longimicrobiales bacterium]